MYILKLKRRFSAFALALVCLAAQTAQFSANAETEWVLTGYKGDIDASMAVDANDVKIFADYLHTHAAFEQGDFAVADMDGGNTLDAADLSVIKRVALGFAEATGIYTEQEIENPPVTNLTLADMPSDYTYAMEWIWNNRISAEDSTGTKSQRYNGIFDQIIAGNGELNYVIRWQSTKTISYETRQKFEDMIERNINSWTDYLVGYDNWPYEHVNVNVVGWAVADKNVLLDLHDDEVVWTNTTYDTIHDENNAVPSALPNAPDELSRFEHFWDRNYVYPGTRFDMYIWATEGWGFGGCGGDWGQRMSDDFYLGALDSQYAMILQHEMGHGFGLTDFYGGEGASDGFPPGGFPGGGTSVMMAGSSGVITDFDSWMLRYTWSKIRTESGRF